MPCDLPSRTLSHQFAHQNRLSYAPVQWGVVRLCHSILVLATGHGSNNLTSAWDATNRTVTCAAQAIRLLLHRSQFR